MEALPSGITSFRSILVAVGAADAAARHAVGRAALIAAQHRARLTLLKVVDPCGKRTIKQKLAQAQIVLGEHAAEIAGRHDIHVRTVVQVGDLLQHVCTHMEDADLLVVAASGRKRWKDLLLPTVAERLSRRLDKPLLVTKQPVQGRYRKVLVPVGFTATSEAALAMAATVAPSARLHLFHALSPHPASRLRADVAPALVREYEDEDRLQGVHRLRSIGAALNHPDVHVSVEHGHPVHLTLERQKKMRADLVVMGKNGRSAVVDFLLGSVATRALADSPCDVLLIPAASVAGRVVGARTSGHDGADPLFAPIVHRRVS
jgi:nucleotide-binding universal stress UspA family protein